MPSRSRGYNPQEEDQKLYTPAQWVGGIGAPAVSGALAGSTFGVPGAIVGGIGGGILGAIQTAEAQQAYLQSQAQQAALEKELASRDVYDRALQQEGLMSAAGRDEALLQARQAAVRGGLSPQATAQLEQQAVTDIAAGQAAARPGLFLSAQQADLARRGQVLNEYTTAQQLASANAPPDFTQLYGQLTGAVAQAGTQAKSVAEPAIPTYAPTGGVAGATVGAAPPSTPPLGAAGARVTEPSAPAATPVPTPGPAAAPATGPAPATTAPAAPARTQATTAKPAPATAPVATATAGAVAAPVAVVATPAAAKDWKTIMALPNDQLLSSGVQQATIDAARRGDVDALLVGSLAPAALKYGPVEQTIPVPRIPSNAVVPETYQLGVEDYYQRGGR